MVKPFASPSEAPVLLYRMALVLAGLRLGKGMSVLEFGAGTCWFSRFLSQMQCATISVDVSEHALAIGQRLFETLPVLGAVQPHQFVHFDGRHLCLPDEIVDRVVCLDAFHHVPNQQQVLGELCRVLKRGGIAAFSEPGWTHSQAPQAQYEMANYNVLENDIVLEDIRGSAIQAGFTNLWVKPLSNPDLDLTFDEYISIVRNDEVPKRLARHIVASMIGGTVFFLAKGDPSPDSRAASGLSHKLTVDRDELRAQTCQPTELKITAVNTGGACWLSRAHLDLGTVKIGAHLYTAEGRLLDLDFFRALLAKDVAPTETARARIAVTFPKPGSYLLCVDLVSEGVCWFENQGSQPAYVRVTVA
jgi:SAM-dependent methyltransferase